MRSGETNFQLAIGKSLSTAGGKKRDNLDANMCTDGVFGLQSRQTHIENRRIFLRCPRIKPKRAFLHSCCQTLQEVILAQMRLDLSPGCNKVWIRPLLVLRENK